MNYPNGSKLLLALVVVFRSAATFAEYRNDYTAQARVTNVEPQYRNVQVATPTETCWDEQVQQAPYKSYTSTILGGIVGGVLGNQVGKGTGKDVATVAGTVLGASVGNDVSNRNVNSQYYGTQKRCQVSNQYRNERQINGYVVTYEYNGRTYQTQTAQHPGNEIPVIVSVTPAYQ